jgi:hypothetical protein
MTNLQTTSLTDSFGRILLGRPLLRDEASELAPLLREQKYAPGDTIL